MLFPKFQLHTGRAASPEVSSSNLSGAGASSSPGSLGVQDFMNPEALKAAKQWRFQKLSKGQHLSQQGHHKSEQVGT
ncbi:TPA: hypothetical protein ACH3X3_007348 [Trebouxia sp. C0006]